MNQLFFTPFLRPTLTPSGRGVHGSIEPRFQTGTVGSLARGPVSVFGIGLRFEQNFGYLLMTRF